MYLVKRQSDMCKGRGLMVNDKCFEALHDAQQYIDQKQGVMGHIPEGGRIRYFKVHGDYCGCWEIVEIDVSPASIQGPDEVLNPDWSGVVDVARSVVSNVLDGSYHEDINDSHYIYEEVMKAVYGEHFFDWFNKNTDN